MSETSNAPPSSERGSGAAILPRANTLPRTHVSARSCIECRVRRDPVFLLVLLFRVILTSGSRRADLKGPRRSRRRSRIPLSWVAHCEQLQAPLVDCRCIAYVSGVARDRSHPASATAARRRLPLRYDGDRVGGTAPTSGRRPARKFVLVGRCPAGAGYCTGGHGRAPPAAADLL